ncbi:probable G-protein coupled receptor 139 [Mercenaria mercenaria]|uniref:probable G-protein coupled receptor 139 n=1 Tax=Mercenaria mercenaria TaxID=6596 RepID=UPI001E1D6F37|nr:probable G-protein coupled receptor 139 [Mercenaria mercenaria]XP_045193972.1 probable G-protein coupled receptor 139 [Mercenaria mercenaria]
MEEETETQTSFTPALVNFNSSFSPSYFNRSNMTQLIPHFGFHEDEITFEKVFEIYVVPVLVVIGTIGNILILITVRQKNMCNWSICFYLGAYAVVNIIILVPMSGFEWLCKVTGTKYVTELSDWTCKLWQFVMGVSIYSGIWFMYAMLVDQYIVIWLPHKAQSLCTIFMAKFATVIIVIGLVVVSIHAIWTYELFTNGCFVSPEQGDILTVVWPWVSLSCYCIIPLVLIIIFIILVIYGSFTKNTWKKSSSNYQVPIDITFMTVALSIFYVIFVAPATVLNIMEINLPTSWLHDPEFYKAIMVAVTVGDLLTFLNPTFAFVICVSFSSTFRLELQERIRSLCCENVIRVYEMQVNAASGIGNDPEDCSETTPL